jgi:hypothetical protein
MSVPAWLVVSADPSFGAASFSFTRQTSRACAAALTRIWFHVRMHACVPREWTGLTGHRLCRPGRVVHPPVLLCWRRRRYACRPHRDPRAPSRMTSHWMCRGSGGLAGARRCPDRWARRLDLWEVRESRRARMPRSYSDRVVMDGRPVRWTCLAGGRWRFATAFTGTLMGVFPHRRVQVTAHMHGRTDTHAHHFCAIRTRSSSAGTTAWAARQVEYRQAARPTRQRRPRGAVPHGVQPRPHLPLRRRRRRR